MIRRAAHPIRFDVLVLAAAVGLALLLPTSAALTADARRAPPAASLELQPSQRSDLDAIEIEFADPRQPRSPRRAVTDLLVVLLPGRATLDRALDVSGGRGIATERRLFRVRVTAVSGGRMYRGPTAWCSGFDAERSVCDVECDGGRFMLRRTAAAESAFSLIVGPVAGDDGSDEAGGGATGGISLSACSLDGAADTRLVARHGTAADIALISD